MANNVITIKPENIRQVLSNEEMTALQEIIDKLLINNIKLEIIYSEIIG